MAGYHQDLESVTALRGQSPAAVDKFFSKKDLPSIKHSYTQPQSQYLRHIPGVIHIIHIFINIIMLYKDVDFFVDNAFT